MKATGRRRAGLGCRRLIVQLSSRQLPHTGTCRLHGVLRLRLEELRHVRLRLIPCELLWRVQQGMMGLAGMAEDLASQRKALAQEKQQRIRWCSRREAYIHVVGPDTIDHAAGEGGDRQTREVVLD